MSNDGNYFAIGTTLDSDPNLRLFHKSSSTPLWSKNVGNGFWDVGISADGRYIVAAGGDYYLYLFHRNSSTPIWKLTLGDYGFRACAISDDGFWIVAGHSNGNLYMFNRTSPTPMWVYQTLPDIWRIDMSSDGSVFVVRNGNLGLVLFNRTNPAPLIHFNAFVRLREAVDLSEDGKWLVATDYDSKLRLYNTSKRLPVWVSTELVRYASISGDGQYIAAGMGSLYFYERTNSTPIWSYDMAPNFVSRVKISADGNNIAVGASGTNGLFYFNSNNSVPLWFSVIGGNGPECMGISFNGSYVAVGNEVTSDLAHILLFHQDSTLPTWDLSPADQISEFGTYFSYDVGASDLSGIAYYWINDTTNFDINANGLITNATSLTTGEYWIEIRAYDPYDNYCSAIINITIIDTTPATWDLSPADQIIEFGTYFSYDVDASDLSGIAYYWINDTTNFDINANGLITNTTSLNVDDYWVEIRAYDPDDNYCSAIINITVMDSTPPTWEINPIDQFIEFGTYFSYDIDASDLSGIAYYWINDTTNFDINANGLITNETFLNVGDYWLEIRAYDPSNNYCSAIIKITIVDSTLPTWDLNPLNQIIEFGNTFSYDVNASDFSGIAYYWINNTTNFNIDSNGLITEVISLNVGEYWLEIRAYDPYDNYCSAFINNIVTDTTPPTWDINPIDQIIIFGNNFAYDIDASDLSGIAYHWINDTTNFDINTNGLITEVLSLNVGEYWLEIRAYDPFDNYCNIIIMVIVTDPGSSPNIPGYKISIIFYLMCITIVGVITYIRKKL